MTNTVASLLANRRPLPATVLGNWLRPGQIILLYAPAGAGKTYFSLSLAHALASGNSFCGWQVPTPKNVIYFDGEMGQSLLERIEQVDNSPLFPNGVGDNYHLRSFEMCELGIMWNLADGHGQAKYTKAIQETNADVIFIDNLNTCHQLNDRYDCDLEAWKRIQLWLIQQRSEGKIIFIIHHAGKSGDQLGTSQRNNIVDWVIKLKHSRVKREGANCVDLLWEKQRHVKASELPDLHLKFEIIKNEYGEAVNYKHAPLDKIIRQEIEFMLGRNMPVTAIIDRLGVPKWMVYDVQNDAPHGPDTDFQLNSREEIW